jgi:dephospho-CoA kinase
VAESLRIIGVAGKAGAGKDTFYEHVLKPRGFLRWQMTLHYKVWLVATGSFSWEDIFITKPPLARKALQEEITDLRKVWSEEIWLHTFQTWMRALQEIVGVECTGIAVTDLRFLIEMRGIKAMGGKILHLEAPDQQAHVAPELRGHRSEVELDSPETQFMRDAYSQRLPLPMATRLRSARDLP